MCGIAGFYSENSKLEERIFKPFLDSLIHRGPDGFGISSFHESRLLLGHRRLAILDTTEGGRQPMVSDDGRFAITFNGEIYNFLELRKELETFGYRFRSQSDTEVILASFSHWGESCQLRFNGMWAFGIWDNRDKRLFLSRDRFGVKPLYYLHNRGVFAFASEVKAFLRLPDSLRPAINPGVIAWGETYESAKKTLLENVMNLNAGHQLIFQEGKPIDIRQWWRTSDHLTRSPATYQEQVDKFRDLFLDACKIRMRSDVAVGTALSGGIDSSAVICGMAHVQARNDPEISRQASDWRKAFVLDYANTPHSERKFAEQVVKHVGADGIFLETDPRKINAEELVATIFDFEGIQQPALGPWMIYREMRRKGIFVSIDGHGGDELLGGYFHYCQPAMVDAAMGMGGKGRWDDLQMVHAGLFQADEGPDGFRPIMPPSRSSVLFDYCLENAKSAAYMLLPRGGNGRRVIKNLRNWMGGKSSLNFWRVKPTDLAFGKKEKVPKFDRLNQALYDDFHFGMLPNILRNFDRLSMAHGVEIRAPLLDWRLVTFAFSLPSFSKLGGGFTKRILRDSMFGLMPESIRTRKSKIGFASPMRTWLAGPLKDFVLDIIHSVSFRTSDIWDGVGLCKEIEKGYKINDYGGLERYWPYIQAGVLINQLK